MSIRKFRKNMKPFIFVITIVFLLSLIVGGYESFKTSRMNKKVQEAFAINGDYIGKVDIEREKAKISETFSKTNISLDKDLVEIIAIDEVINKKLSLDIAKKLKVKIPSNEIDKQFEEIEKSIGDKEQFRRMLEYQGLTKSSYKAQIKEELLLQKTREEFAKSVLPTEEEILNYYNTYINDKTSSLEENRENIIKTIQTAEGYRQFDETLAAEKKKMVLKDISTEYENSFEKISYEEEGFSITNLDLAKQTLQIIITSGLTKDDAEKAAKETITRQIKLMKAAQEKGIEVDSNLSFLEKFNLYSYKLIGKIREEIKPTEPELKEFFESNKMKYEIPETVDINIALAMITPTTEDENAAKNSAEEILKEVNIENFESKGNELKAEKGYIFEDLGTFTAGMMVKEFEEAVKETAANSITPNVVKTQFGYHIIYVKEKDEANSNWKVSHILVRPTPTENTRKEKLEKLNKLVEDLNNGTVNFSEIQKFDKDIVQTTTIQKITPDGLIPNVGFDKTLTDKFFASELNKVEIIENRGNYLLFQKIKETKYEAAEYEKSQIQVKNDYINSKAEEYIRSIF